MHCSSFCLCRTLSLLFWYTTVLATEAVHLRSPLLLILIIRFTICRNLVLYKSAPPPPCLCPMSDAEDVCGPTSVGRVGLRVGAIFVILVRQQSCRRWRLPPLVLLTAASRSVAGDLCFRYHVPDSFEAGPFPAARHSRIGV